MIKEGKQEQRLFDVIDACSSLLNNDQKYGTTDVIYPHLTSISQLQGQKQLWLVV
jgi:hypothetical protein